MADHLLYSRKVWLGEGLVNHQTRDQAKLVVMFWLIYSFAVLWFAKIFIYFHQALLLTLSLPNCSIYDYMLLYIEPASMPAHYTEW